jgi:outer membrane protein OmpA-like peptidoglycan-associated protein
MKVIHVTGAAIAALSLFACGAHAQQASDPQKASEEAKEEKRDADEKAQTARNEASRETSEAQESTRQQHDAEQNARWASQRAALADAQATREQQHQRDPSTGTAERQADHASRVGAASATVLFGVNSAELSSDAKAKLNEVAKTLRGQTPSRNVTLEGYTDAAGPESANVQVSQDRAREVGRYLESRGVAAGRITTKGMGSIYPVGKDASDSGRALNRRVEVVYSK